MIKGGRGRSTFGRRGRSTLWGREKHTFPNQSPDWNQQLSNTSNNICNQTALQAKWKEVEDIFKPFDSVSPLNCNLELEWGYFAAGLPCLLLPPVIFGTTFVWFKTADLALVCSWSWFLLGRFQRDLCLFVVIKTSFGKKLLEEMKFFSRCKCKTKKIATFVSICGTR